MRKSAFLFLLLMFESALWAQEKPAGDFTPATCEDYKTLVKQAWDMEQVLILQATNPPLAPATAVRQLAEKGRAIEHQLFVCSLATDDTQEEKRDLLAIESRNFQFILGAQKENGGRALGEGALFTSSGFPLDLGDVAPSCRDLVGIGGGPGAGFFQEMEHFLASKTDPRKVSLGEVTPYFLKIVELTKCASEAHKVGYKDAAIRILRDLSSIQSLESIAESNQQTPIMQIIHSVSGSAPVPVQVGPRHCEATLRDWGFQKTIDWDCF